MPVRDEAERLAQDIAREAARKAPPEDSLAERLSRAYADADSETFLRAMITREFRGRIAVVSSFGTEAAVLLDLVARIDPATPVIFLDTAMHFPQTLQYRDEVVKHLGLTDVRSIGPDPDDLDRQDPNGTLWQWDTDKCCHVRKVLPLARALKGFDAWINGRKQMHGGARVRLPRLEVNGPHIKVNPLAWWTRADVERAFAERGLPRHPMIEQGYQSIGCWPCTEVSEGPDVRAGRWAGSAKTECGIHTVLAAALSEA